jgi:hypothetical protein
MHRRGSLLSGADRCVAGWRGVIGAGFGGVVSARAQARQLPGPASAAAGEEEEVAEPAPLPLTELLLRELEAYCKQPLLASEGDDPESGGGAGVCSPDGARRRLALLAGLARGCHGLALGEGELFRLLALAHAEVAQATPPPRPPPSATCRRPPYPHHPRSLLAPVAATNTHIGASASRVPVEDELYQQSQNI